MVMPFCETPIWPTDIRVGIGSETETMRVWYVEQWISLTRRATTETRPPSYEATRRDVARLLEFPRRYGQFRPTMQIWNSQTEAHCIETIRKHYQAYMDRELLKLLADDFTNALDWDMLVKALHKNQLWHEALA